jgi:hypothetical protein
MIYTITISIFALVIVNLLLLKFSSNKIARQSKTIKKPVVFRNITTIKLETETLAPTGS